MYYSNHVNEISYCLRCYQLYIKNFVGHNLKMVLWKKPKHVACMIFNYLLIVFTQ